MIQNCKRNTKRGFTLVELLVVIAIIAILMSILMPALQRARKQARAIQCLANLRKMAISVMLYTHENDDYMMYTLVDGVVWCDYLYTHEDKSASVYLRTV